METLDTTPVAVVTRLYQLFGEGRLDETYELMASDVTLREPGNPEVIPWAGEFRGHDGVREFYSGLATGLSEIAIDPDSLRILPLKTDAVLALGTERGVATQSGRAYVTSSAWVWEVRNGKISHLTAYHDTAAMVNALQLT